MTDRSALARAAVRRARASGETWICVLTNLYASVLTGERDA